MYNVAILLPSLDYRNNTNGAINRASMGILWEQISWLITVLLIVFFSIFSMESRWVWSISLLPPIFFDFSIVFMGIKILKSTLTWCLLSDVIIRIIHIIGLLSRGICLSMLITNLTLGIPDLEVPLFLISGTIIFQVLSASFSNSLRCPWVLLRFLFVDIWIVLLLFQIYLRISSETKYYYDISKNNLNWESSVDFHANLASIGEKLHHIPSWWVIFWPCWFWCGIIFAFSTIFCVLGITDRLLGILGIFFGCLSTSILITCLDLADFLNNSIYMKDNKYMISYHFYEQGSHVRLWHICIICTQTLISILSAIITQSLIQERDEHFSNNRNSNENFILTNIKQFKKLLSPYKIGSEITLNKKGTGVFHTIEAKINSSSLDIEDFNNDILSNCSSSTTTSPESNKRTSISTTKLKEFKENSNTDNSELICIICCDSNCEAVFLPCGHGGICNNCALREFYRIGLCPTCRQATCAIAAYKNQSCNINESNKVNAIIIATQDI